MIKIQSGWKTGFHMSPSIYIFSIFIFIIKLENEDWRHCIGEKCLHGYWFNPSTVYIPQALPGMVTENHYVWLKNNNKKRKKTSKQKNE